ncbi:S24 family peptidase [Pseudomonas sp. S9]|uniref:S24 family peptidase n=1 Tax=Pseudomonas sp. S9 TaxID=686578 RepID=UPI0002556DDA
MTNPQNKHAYIVEDKQDYLQGHKPPYKFDRMNELGKRIKAARAHARLTQKELAERVGISQPVISQLEKGENLQSVHLIKISSQCGVSPIWLETGRGEMLAQQIEPNAELIGVMSGWDNDTPLRDDEVAIPLYKEVEMAAGCGATQVIEAPGRLLRFAKSTLREAGVLERNAACATVRGRSMERLIMDGATIGIDRGSVDIEDGEIYAFDHDGMLRVKYLYRLPGGGLRIRSENDEEYPDEVISAQQASELRILGWVFWWSTVRRRRGLSIAK